MQVKTVYDLDRLDLMKILTHLKARKRDYRAKVSKNDELSLVAATFTLRRYKELNSYINTIQDTIDIL